jgi:phage-related protein
MFYIASSFRDQERLPEAVREAFSVSLSFARGGGYPDSAKPWKGEGPGVFELVEDYRGGTYRAVYTVRFSEAMYVLHVFEKKSKSGIKTPQLEIEKVRARLSQAREHYEQNFSR